VAPDTESPPPHLVWVWGSQRRVSFIPSSCSGGVAFERARSRGGYVSDGRDPVRALLRFEVEDRLRCRGAFLNFPRVSWRILFSCAIYGPLIIRVVATGVVVGKVGR